LSRSKVDLALSLALLVALSSLVYALTNLYYNMPMQANVPVNAEFYVEGNVWQNNTLINWGNVSAGQSYTKTFDVHNIGSCNFTVLFYVSNLPVGWSLTYDKNNTVVQPSTWLNGTLTLTVPANVTSGLKTWNCQIYIIG